MTKKNLLTYIMAWMAALSLHAQQTTMQGTVADSETGERLPYVALRFPGTTIGTSTDDQGRFTLATATPGDSLEVSYLGYDTKLVPIRRGRLNRLDIRLTPSGITTEEVVVRPGKEHYSRRDNPAVRFVREVIRRRDEGDPRQHDFFSYDRYERLIIARNDYKPKERKDGKTGRFDFVREFADTLQSGTTILPLSDKETLESVYFRRQPRSEKKLVRGSKSAGVDEVLSKDGVQQFLGEALKEVDIFQNNIPLLLQRFVSPLSSIGPGFYKYYLLDTLQIDSRPYVDLGFAPFNSESFGFTGHLLVALDSTYFVRRAVLDIPHDINLNFISRMTIDQTFERLPDGTRLTTKDDIQLNFKLTEKSKGLYARRTNVYTGHSFDTPPAEALSLFDRSAPVLTEPQAFSRDEAYWQQVRPKEAEKRNKRTVAEFMARLRSVPLFAITEKVVGTMIGGYLPTHQDPRKNKFDFGPMNSTINGNAIEGARFRVGGATTPVFHPNWFLEGYAAYGTRDKKMKYDLAVEYSFNDRQTFLREFPRHSLRLEYMYDINKLGQHYLYTSKDNIMLAIRRKQDTRATYLRTASLTYLREHYNGISYSATVRNNREQATPYAEFLRIGADGSTTPVPHYDMTSLELNFRYAYKEKIYQTHDNRIPITFDAWIFNLSHTMTRKGLLGSDYDYQHTEFGMQKRFWFSAFGYLDVILKAGKVWNKVPYPLLILPNANLTYTIQPESYTNMNAMEFINDEYASWDVTYYMNGLVLNRIPLVKKLQWREVFCFRGLWGHLTDKNNPALGGEGLYQFPAGSGTLGRKPYMEASVGIENIFKFLRLDYVWRLNYRDRPDIQKHGIRATMRISF